MSDVIWVLDMVGYDTRGGSARVFSSSDRAKAAAPSVKNWKPTDDGFEQDDPSVWATEDIWVIYPRAVDA